MVTKPESAAVEDGEAALADLTGIQESMVRAQIDAERERISRQLHEVLGRTLVAVSLRSQAALRLAGRDPAMCRDQLIQIAAAVNDAQRNLRELVTGQVVIGLESELEIAGELLAGLGIDLQVERKRMPSTATELLGARIVREAVTNALKHSRPDTVEITLSGDGGDWILRVSNNGVLDTTTYGGTGLTDLAAQMRCAGGTLEASRVGDEFVVTARVRELAGG